MPEYIEREALLHALRMLDDKMSDSAHTVMDQVIALVEYSKVADVVERKRGKWIPAPPEYDGETPFVWWICSECNQKIYSETERDRIEFHAFCGRCGADMREDGDT